MSPNGGSTLLLNSNFVEGVLGIAGPSDNYVRVILEIPVMPRPFLNRLEQAKRSIALPLIPISPWGSMGIIPFVLRIHDANRLNTDTIFAYT